MEDRSPILSPGPGHFRLFLALLVVYEHVADVMLGRGAVFLFFVGYTGLAPRLLEPAWSLDVEMQFYLVAPVLALVLTKLGALRFAAVLIGFTALAWLLDMPGQLQLVGWFAVGMAAAALPWRPGKRLVACCILAAVALLLLVLASDMQAIVTDRNFHSQNTALNWLLAAILVPLAVRSCHQASDGRDRFLGDLSYPIYLVHWLLVVLAYQYLPDDGISRLLYTLAGSILLSIVILRWVDMPLQGLRSRWVGQRYRQREAARDQATLDPEAGKLGH